MLKRQHGRLFHVRQRRWAIIGILMFLSVSGPVAARSVTFVKGVSPNADQTAFLKGGLLVAKIRDAFPMRALPAGSRVFWSANYLISDHGKISEFPFYASTRRTKTEFVVMSPGHTQRFSGGAKLGGVNHIRIVVVFPGQQPDTELRRDLAESRATQILTK